MKNKIPPPIVTLLFGVTIYLSKNIFTHPNCNFLDWASIILLLFGIFIIRSAFLLFRNYKTTINPVNLSKTSSLVNTGVFKYTRNPMYLGMALILLSIGLKFNLYGGIIFVIIFIVFITRFQIIPEEKAMEKLFEKEFLNYKGKTRRWI